MSPRPLELDLWNVLHDGGIDSISGSVPGEVRLTVGITYLRELFEDPGESVLITLHDCTFFSFRPWDTDESVADLAAISALELEVLSVEEGGGIVCAVSAIPAGVLLIKATGFSLALDNDRPIELEDLLAVAKTHWDRFGEGAP